MQDRCLLNDSAPCTTRLLCTGAGADHDPDQLLQTGAGGDGGVAAPHPEAGRGTASLPQGVGGTDHVTRTFDQLSGHDCSWVSLHQ
jgi:hypothetical protein